LKVCLGNRFFWAQKFPNFSIGHNASPKFRTLWRSEPRKSNPASQGKGDVQKSRTLRAPDLSKVQLGAGGEKLKFLT